MGTFAPFFFLQLSKQYVPEDKRSLPPASGEGPAKCSHLVTTRGKSIEKIGSKEGWLTSFTSANEWGLDFGAVAIHALSDRYQTSRGHPEERKRTSQYSQGMVGMAHAVLTDPLALKSWPREGPDEMAA